MPWPAGLKRKGVAVNLTLEAEAVGILRSLCGNHKGYGLLVSQLLRQEEQRRQEARQRREASTEVLTA